MGFLGYLENWASTAVLPHSANATAAQPELDFPLFVFCFLRHRTETCSHAQPQKKHYCATAARREQLDCIFSKDQEKRGETYGASHSGSLYIHTTRCKWWHTYSY